MRYLIPVIFTLMATGQETAQPTVLGRPLRSSGVSPKAMASEIQLALIEHYSVSHGIEPTPREIERLNARRKEGLHSMSGVVEASAERLRQDLIRHGIDPETAARQASEFSRTESNRDRNWTLMFIRYWKVGRELHRQYGGRVRLSAFGFHEPMDAMERFLIEEERQGRFTLPSPEVRAAVWAVFQNKSGGDGTVSGSSAAAIYATPPWETRP